MYLGTHTQCSCLLSMQTGNDRLPESTRNKNNPFADGTLPKQTTNTDGTMPPTAPFAQPPSTRIQSQPTQNAKQCPDPKPIPKRNAAPHSKTTAATTNPTNANPLPSPTPKLPSDAAVPGAPLLPTACTIPFIRSAVATLGPLS